MQVYTLDDILTNPAPLIQQMNKAGRPVALFHEYLKYGYYPYYLDNETDYYLAIQQVVNHTIDDELTKICKVDVGNTRKIKALMTMLCASEPYQVDISKLSVQSGLKRETVVAYLNYMGKSKLLQLLYCDLVNAKRMQKPDKIYIDNPNMLYAWATTPVKIGTARETYVVNQLTAKHVVEFGKKQGDFKIDGKYRSKIGLPAGSAKDRVGRAMIEAAEQDGSLQPGGTIIEATAGNTGLGVAFAALNRGYRVIFVVPEKFSAEKQTLMQALGAELVHTPRAGGMLGAAAKAEELRQEIPGAITLKQFENPANPRAHYETTGPEIYEDLDGQVDYLVSGAGSGGTFSGIVKYLKERNPAIQGVLADPYGSIIGGGEHGDYEIEGIGNDFIAKTMDTSLIDKVYKITDEEAFQAVRRLALKEGIFAGSSSGAALAAALKLAAEVGRGNIVVPVIDRAERYFSKKLLG